MRPSKLKVGDLVLLSTEHYNLQLPSQKLAPKWLGPPLKVLELSGPNTVASEHAQDVLRAYQARQTNDLSSPASPSRAQRAPRALRRMGHMFYYVPPTRSADTRDCV